MLGISSGFHDAAAALLIDGSIAAAVAEERLSRTKHDASFPERAIDCCLAIAGIAPDDVDVVAFHEKPLDVAERHLASKLRAGPAGLPGLVSRTPAKLAGLLGVGRTVERWFRRRGAPPPPILWGEHHTSHAAAAFYPSPFRDAAILTVDGVGEWACTSIGEGTGRRVRLDRELRYPNSIGLLYSAMTVYCGFRANGGEGELMGLAPFGEPRYADALRELLLDRAGDGSFRLAPGWFGHIAGSRGTTRRFHERFGGPPRPLGSPPTQREADLAASVQVIVEELLLELAAVAHELTGHDHLVIAGGVALNCVANGRILREGPFDDVWVQPAAGDDGAALGAALWAWHDVLEQPRAHRPDDAMQGAFLGPSFSDEEIDAWLATEGIEAAAATSTSSLHEMVADRLADGAVVGWFQGRMEFGPRALGHRSILADPRSPDVQERVNALVKERASFRPFAPAVLEEHAASWFDLDRPLRYMTATVQVAQPHLRPVDGAAPDLLDRVRQVRSEIPAVTHVDGSARVQCVDPARDPHLGGLLAAFHRRTGCPVLLNTSFNARDEPIVCTPADALRTFRRTGLDLLVLGNRIVERA